MKGTRDNISKTKPIIPAGKKTLMKHVFLTLFIVATAMSCNQKNLNDNAMSNLSSPKNPVSISKSGEGEVFTLYRKTENIFHVARALTTNTGDVDLHLYEVDTSTPEGAKQTFVSLEHLTQQQLAKRKTELQSSNNWIPFKKYEVLFVQIQPNGFKDEIELLDKRQDIEAQLSNELESKRLGEWLASDIGPGGGNMLYKVSDVDSSLEAVLTVFRRNNLITSVLVGRRVFVADGEWFYEVIYPTNFTGNFNTM
ncbi:hypothetical protein BH10ACI2_BH10ACI2_19170 [soil metagenome]